MEILKNSSFGAIKFSIFFWAIILLSNSTSYSQDFLELKEVIVAPTPVINRSPEESVKPYFQEATVNGGRLEVAIRYKQNASQYCTCIYRFEWQFSKPIDKLFKQQPIDINFKVTRLSDPCPSGNGKMIAIAATGASPKFKQLGIRYSGGITVKPSKWIQAGVSSTTESYVSTIIVQNPKVDYATFKINFESSGFIGSEKLHYEAVYLFQPGHGTKSNCDPDLVCPNLFSVGVLIGFAEYGALKNDDPLFLAKQIDGAIVHAESSKCVPTEDLKEMSSRLKSASSSRSFHDELTKLRDKIARYVEINCNCCK